MGEAWLGETTGRGWQGKSASPPSPLLLGSPRISVRVPKGWVGPPYRPQVLTASRCRVAVLGPGAQQIPRPTVRFLGSQWLNSMQVDPHFSKSQRGMQPALFSYRTFACRRGHLMGSLGLILPPRSPYPYHMYYKVLLHVEK